MELIRILKDCMNLQVLNINMSKDTSEILENETYQTLILVTWEAMHDKESFFIWKFYKGKLTYEHFPIVHMVVYGLIENPVVLNIFIVD